MKQPDHDIAEILSAHRTPPQSTDAVRRLAGALRQEMAARNEERAQVRRGIALRLTVAGIVALPLLIAFNLAVVLGMQEVYGLILPHTVATGLAVLFGIGSVFGLSVTYGSLPVIGAYAMKMKGYGHAA